MLAIGNKPSSTRKITPNVLPCAIKHDGPIDAEERHWSPSQSDHNGNSIAYFRGRKLCGTSVKLPDGFQGVVLQKTDQLLPPKAPTVEQLRRMEEEDEDGEDAMAVDLPQEVKMMQPMATFDKVMIWGHETVPDGNDDYVKGIREWMSFASAMHSYETSASSAKAT